MLAAGEGEAPVVMPNQMAAVTVLVMASSMLGRSSPCSSCTVMPEISRLSVIG